MLCTEGWAARLAAIGLICYWDGLLLGWAARCAARCAAIGMGCYWDGLLLDGLLGVLLFGWAAIGMGCYWDGLLGELLLINIQYTGIICNHIMFVPKKITKHL